jgi:hypothetical protein
MPSAEGGDGNNGGVGDVGAKGGWCWRLGRVVAAGVATLDLDHTQVSVVKTSHVMFLNWDLVENKTYNICHLQNLTTTTSMADSGGDVGGDCVGERRRVQVPRGESSECASTRRQQQWCQQQRRVQQQQRRS